PTARTRCGPSSSACWGTTSRSSTPSGTSSWPTKPSPRRAATATRARACAGCRRGGDCGPSEIARAWWAFRPRPAAELAAAREEIARRAEESSDLGARLSNLMSWVHDAMTGWDRDRFDFAVTEGRRLADESRAPFWRATATSAEALAATIDGRYDDA